MKIQGCVALVTGSNRGLGRALVTALLDAGATKVYAAAREPTKVSARDPRVIALALDTSKSDEIAAAARVARDVTLLVNNAGVSASANVLTSSQAALDTDFHTNVFGTLAVIKGFLPVLERAPDGATIVNVLSLVSLGSFPVLGGYSASKAAAYSMTQSLRPELKRKRIDILAALPGPIDTDMVRDLAIPKASPAEVAQGVLAGVQRGEEEIFPDPMAQQMGALWNKSHKEFERAFASF
ncbi:MAG: SDR family oxidoreductase [Deltaproteobacteria bacterium]|nr:SDR family oxidoreductase [Deltaproteobacteria bacterium]